MRLWELLKHLDEKSLSAVEKDLDINDYQPPEKVIAGKEPTIDMDLLSSGHFQDRLIQRSKTAGITPDEVEDLLHRGRQKYKVEIGMASRQDQFPGNQIDFYDPESKLLIPTIVAPNPQCKPSTRGKITCQTPKGVEPKNRLVAKTVIRKGTPD